MVEERGRWQITKCALPFTVPMLCFRFTGSVHFPFFSQRVFFHFSNSDLFFLIIGLSIFFLLSKNRIFFFSFNVFSFFYQTVSFLFNQVSTVVFVFNNSFFISLNFFESMVVFIFQPNDGRLLYNCHI